MSINNLGMFVLLLKALSFRLLILDVSQTPLSSIHPKQMFNYSSHLDLMWSSKALL